MISANRPIINLDLDLLNILAVADLNTFAAAAAAVCRTQSAVSQQMQRLEQLVGKELFARHGRNKLLTEHGIQLLGYARKILRFNDEACSSLMFSNLQGVLTIGASDESADTILPFLLNRVSSVYPEFSAGCPRVKRNAYMAEMLESQEVDLMVTTHRPSAFKALNLRTSPTHWYCAAEYILQKGEQIPLVLLDDPSPFRDMVLATLNKADIPWRLAYVASTLPAIRAVKAGLGVTARPVEMMSPDLRVLSGVDGLPPLPDTEYLLCYDPSSNNEAHQVIYQAMESYHNPWQYSPMSAPEGDDSLLIERDIE
ncbi:transcriptional regulator LrhA [Escherichia coli]